MKNPLPSQQKKQELPKEQVAHRGSKVAEYVYHDRGYNCGLDECTEQDSLKEPWSKKAARQMVENILNDDWQLNSDSLKKCTCKLMRVHEDGSTESQNDPACPLHGIAEEEQSTGCACACHEAKEPSKTHCAFCMLFVQRGLEDSSALRQATHGNHEDREAWEDSEAWNEACGELAQGWGSQKMLAYIKDTFIPRADIEKVLQNGHGGGNWRRLLNLLLSKKE